MVQVQFDILLIILTILVAVVVANRPVNKQQQSTKNGPPAIVTPKTEQPATEKNTTGKNIPEPGSGTWVYTTKKGVVWIDHGKGKDLFAGRRMPASKLERWTPFLFLIGTALFFATLVWLLNKLP